MKYVRLGNPEKKTVTYYKIIPKVSMLFFAADFSKIRTIFFFFKNLTNLSPVRLLKKSPVHLFSIFYFLFFSFKLESNDKTPDFFLQNFNFLLSPRTKFFFFKFSRLHLIRLAKSWQNLTAICSKCTIPFGIFFSSFPSNCTVF